MTQRAKIVPITPKLIEDMAAQGWFNVGGVWYNRVIDNMTCVITDLGLCYRCGSEAWHKDVLTPRDALRVIAIVVERRKDEMVAGLDVITREVELAQKMWDAHKGEIDESVYSDSFYAINREQRVLASRVEATELELAGLKEIINGWTHQLKNS